MKITLMFFILTVPIPSMADQLCIEASTTDIKIVETYVPNARQWLIGSWKGKVSGRKAVIIKEEVNNSISEGSGIPPTETMIIDKAFARPYYKTRVERDADDKAKLDALIEGTK